MTTIAGTIYRALLIAILLAGHVLAMDTAPSTSTVLKQMESADVNEGAEQSLVDEGDEMFHATCSQCHATERAISKRKTYDEWLFTVRRMAAKEGANIPESRHVPIATYLTSLNPVETNVVETSGTPTIGEVLAASSMSVHATVSLLWRKGDQQVENSGFFPDVWVGADWQQENSPFSIQVMACTSCHDDPNGLKIELVEGSFRADLIQMMTRESAEERASDLKLEAKAGRFLVPFGAYSGMSHPGVYRTLTNPLMYNMGRRVGYYEPVLPMPYADEGIDVHAAIPIMYGFQTQIDGYAINGLQEFGFSPSRSYRDNNNNVALGGRASLGSSWITIGGSFARGELQATGATEKSYRLEGGDVTVHYGDWFRAYYEYARREEDTTPTLESTFSGHVVELEGMMWRNPRLTMLVRYDTIKNPATYGGASIERITWGPTLTLPGGSLLIVNHEHWAHEPPLISEDIIGARWIVAF